MKYFVKEDSIVRIIWGKSDTILFIFAGAAAEFALNKAVDWLYFTGKLPAAPLERLFSTVEYARHIVFASEEKAHATIDKIRSIHGSVETARQQTIPDWAYRDVLYMLIHYSIASFELLERKLSNEEKEDVYNVFYRMGVRMKIPSLPAHFADWLNDRQYHLNHHLSKSNYTIHLFQQYKKHLGAVRFQLLRQVQMLITPPEVRRQLPFKQTSVLKPVIKFYKLNKKIKTDYLWKALLLPKAYKTDIKNLDSKPTPSAIQ